MVLHCPEGMKKQKLNFRNLIIQIDGQNLSLVTILFIFNIQEQK